MKSVVARIDANLAALRTWAEEGKPLPFIYVFGPFRHSDETEARGVTYRGRWPKGLPESLTGQR